MVYGDPMSRFDYYAAARKLISRLESAGHATEAASLNAAIEEGATGTEILMALRFHVADILERIPLTGDARALASRLLAELRDALDEMPERGE